MMGMRFFTWAGTVRMNLWFERAKVQVGQVKLWELS